MFPLPELVGASPGVVAVREMVGRLLRQAGSRRLPPVLIEGETGTGKGLLARLLHRAGPRCDGPFVHVNCAAIPDALLEAELFGFERGAFTDARQAKPGLFQAAHGGVLFLDEVALLPEGLQGKLLTALEERAVRRLGSTRGEPVDVAIVAASGEDLKAAMRERRFHEALYHRLSVVVLRLPPLRERGSDILVLAEVFLTRACTDYKLRQKTLTPDARTALLAYRWPGNVRELNNLMERVALLSEASDITGEIFGLPAPTPAVGQDPVRTNARGKSRGTAARPERETLTVALAKSGGNITHAATDLGIPPNTLRYRLKKHGLLEGTSPRVPRGAPEPVPSVSAVAAMPPSPAPKAPRWERRCLATLRAELVSLPANMAPAPADAGRAMTVLLEKVQNFGGRVEDIGPAEVVAVFGLEPVEDAPRRAAHAAMSIQNALRPDLLPDVPPAAAKIGIHVCHGLVGWLDERLSLDLESKRHVLGVLEASMERVEPGTICVTASAVAFLETRFQLEVIDAGQIASDQVFRLTGGDRRGFGNPGRLTRFVGRGVELEQLRRTLSRARDRHGQVVAIVGEPGAGKSRLVWEVTNSPAMHGWLILQAGAASYGKATSYLPVIDLLKEYFGIEDRDDTRRIREKATSRLTTLDGTLETVLPVVLSLLEAQVEDAQWAALDPPQRRRRMLDAVKRLLLRESQVQPVLVVVEDLHWIDAETQAVLDSLVESLPAARLVLLVNYRPEYQHGWGRKTYYTQLRLDPLPPESAQELLQVLLGRDPTLAPLERLLIERTEGNPFFLEEIVRTLVEAGVLAGDRAARRLARPLDAIQIPATVDAVLATRINRLPPEERTLLQTAAVVGKAVPFALLEAVADRSEAQLQDTVARLQAAEFLYETGVYPDLEYTFRHALTHEVAYESLLPDRRRALHARIVDTLARKEPGRLVEHVERLAHHALRGERWAEAVTYARQAALKAVGRNASQEAVDRFGDALASLARLPETAETMKQAVDLRLELLSALIPFGDVDRMITNLREAETLATSLGDQARLGRIAAHMTHCYWFTGDLHRARDSGERARTIAQAVGDVSLEVLANYRLSRIDLLQGRYGRALDLSRRSVEILAAEPGLKVFLFLSPAIGSREMLGRSLMALGETREAIAVLEEGIRLSEAMGHEYSRGFAYYQLGGALASNGHLPEAIHWLERSLALFRQENQGYLIALATSRLGWAYALSGRRAEGLAMLEEADLRFEALRLQVHIPINRLLLGEAAMLEGHVEKAKAYAQSAFDLSRTRGQRDTQAGALRLLGDVHATSEPPDAAQAETAYREGLAIAEEVGDRPLAARCHLGLGRLHRRVGRPDQARKHLTIGATMLREMDMRYWLAEADIEIKHLG
jgi:transcriptional regulator with AAA-type ATPase domain/tetratricopeptide (TPR) repeat protein